VGYGASVTVKSFLVTQTINVNHPSVAEIKAYGTATGAANSYYSEYGFDNYSFAGAI
jgi:hypothetical protein